jgi:hypothetical protein
MTVVSSASYIGRQPARALDTSVVMRATYPMDASPDKLVLETVPDEQTEVAPIMYRYLRWLSAVAV